MKKYEPISCSVYDHLEIFAMRKQPVEVILKNGNSTTGVIQTLEARKNDGEYLILENDAEHRLDTIHTVNGIALNQPSC